MTEPALLDNEEWLIIVAKRGHDDRTVQESDEPEVGGMMRKPCVFIIGMMIIFSSRKKFLYDPRITRGKTVIKANTKKDR